MDTKMSSLNDPPRLLPGSQLLHDLIQWDEHKDSYAVDFTSHDKREKYRYKDIQACVASLVARIQSTLRNHQIFQQQHVIPILLPQSPGLYISQLAILQSGGAFCPINLDAPKERIRFVAGDVSASIVITTSEFKELVSWDNGPSIIVVDEFPAIPTELEEISESREPTSNDLAYIMYTSGSSGTPKGVAVSHLAVSQSLLAHEGLIPKFERFLQFAAPSFDVSVFEIFFPLTRGQTLVGCDRSQLLNDLTGMINKLDIDAVELTPTVVGALLQKRAYVPKLRLLMTIGEMLTRPIVEEFGGSDTKESVLYGMYGPTEAAIHCTIHPKMQGDAKPGNIGVPFETVSAFIAEAASGPGMEQNIQFLPQGELGELILGGPQLANGYLNREGQNKAAFVTMGGKSYYRTGDKGRILADGSIEIDGRMSSGQVKLRGQRVELGEVEDAVYKHRGIKTVVAVVLSGVLIVFALTNDDAINSHQVLSTCSEWLPIFMVPSEIILLREFPYLPSGKVDKRKLEADYLQKRDGEEELTNFTQTEVTVREVLRDVLGLLPSNIRLAAAGLDSLVSIKVSRELRSRGFNITTLAVLQAETLSSLVKVCENCPATPDLTTMKLAVTDSDPHTILNGDANDIEVSYPCTPLQNAMLAETAIDQRAYQNWVELDLPGITNIDYLRTKLHDLADHNPILRTGFAESSDSSGYIQFVWKSFEGSSLENVNAFTHDFDITKDVSLHHPISFQMLSTESHLKLLIHIHHALYDAWSLDLLLDDFDCLLRNETPISRPLFSEVVSGYVDGRLSSESQAFKDYWKDHMAHLELRRMPSFHPRKVSLARLAVAHHTTQLSTSSIDLAAKLMTSSSQAIFQAAYALLLASYLGSSDVCFGTVFSGRTLPIVGIEDIIGPCLATLPIRIDISTASTLQDLVEELNSTNRKHLEFSTLPLRDIKSVNGFEPRQQLFDTLLIWQQTLHSYDHSRKNVQLVDQADQLEFNLTLEIIPTINTIHFKANYQQSIFPEYQIDLLLRQLEEITKAIIEHSEDSPNNVFNGINPEILSIENPTPSVALGPETLTSPVEKIASEDPHRPAIAFASRIDEVNSEIQYMSYSALNTRANQLGHYLSYHGIFPDDIVCICLEKSHDLYASILAIAKVGAGYLPVTPDTPQDRLQHILHEAKVKILIAHSVSRPVLEKFVERDIIYIDEIDLSQQSTDNMTCAWEPENTSYCIFTSGSTGIPKGVLVTQGNLLSNLDVLVEIYPANRDSKLLQSCSQAFDVSVFEIFFTWRVGGCLCSAVKDDLFRDIELAIRVLGVTHLSLTPTVAALIDPQNVPKVKFLVTAGEAVTQKVFNTWASFGLYQGYGPSETTNICTVKPRVTLDDRIDNIGPPFKNTSAFVLARDTEFSLVPRGGEGEFCFGGSQVFRGYMNRAQQVGRIIDHPKYGRLYKSGDFGRLMHDGSLVFTGRKDDQVKIRGQRVELGEINNILVSLPEVEDCVTMVINGKGNSQRLVCFFTFGPSFCENLLPLSAEPIVISNIYQSLESKLPSYMVPSNLIPISNLPSTPQGKIDKRALIRLYESFELKYLDSTTRASSSSIDHQWTELELGIRSVLSDISKTSVEDIGPDTSFFSFGIDSISAIAFSRKLRQVFTKEINVSDILRYRSVVRLAEHLSKCEEIEEDDRSLAHKSFHPTEDFVKSTISQFTNIGRVAEKVTSCTPLQEAMISAAESSSGASYSNHTLFKIFGDLERLRGCWQEMVKRHEILRTCFVRTDMPKTPYIQVVLEDFEIEFGYLDSKTLEDAIVELTTQPKNDKNIPPYSFNILRSDDKQCLLLSMHHALYDGVALSVLYDEVEKLYHGLPLPAPVSFTPFLQHIGAMDIESSDKFWSSTLQGYQPLQLEGVLDKPNQAQRNGTRVQRLVVKPPLSQIEKYIKKHSTTHLAAFHAVWATTTSELFKTTDVCFGNVVSGRTAPVDGIERLVAPCFNTIPTRLKDIHKSTYLEAFRKLQNANADSLPFQFTPLRRLQSKFSPDGTRIFDTLFILQQPSKELDSSIWSIIKDEGAMDFPLVCEIVPKPSNDTLEIIFHSSTLTFSEKDANELIQRFENILETALENPRHQMITSSARAQIITISEAREKKRRHLAKKESQDKVMSRLELEIRDMIAGFTDVPLQQIGRDTSIFRLGLDSISTVQVASRLRAHGHNLLASDVLQNPTIARIASHLELNVTFKSEDEDKFDFAAFDRKYRDTICSRTALPNENVEAIRPCTSVQQGMLAQSLHSDGHEYINNMSLELLPGHAITEVRDAWTKVCRAHEMLRTIFAQTEEPDNPFVMVTFTEDYFELPWFESQEQAPSKAINRLVNPWDVTIDQKENRSMLIFTAHHALYDAQSMQLIYSDFAKLYNSQAVASRPSINTLLSSILQASKGDENEKKAFWEQPENRIVVNKFPDLTPLRVAAVSNAVREVKSQASLKELEGRCRDLGVTMQAAGQATWARLLMSYTGENVTTFGMTLSGRSVCDDANMVAFPTIVTIPVNCNVMGSNGELLSRTMLSNAELHKHQFTPLTSIQKWSGHPEGRIFDTLFAYQKLTDYEDEMRLPWKVVDEEATVDYVVSLEVQPTRLNEIMIRLSFREDIVPAAHAELIVKQFDALLVDTLKNPSHPCSVAPEVGIDLLSITPAQNPVLPDSVTLLHQYVERGAKTWPDKVALEFANCLEPGKYHSQKWTYQQVDEEANRVAQMLYARGTIPGEIIAICFDKCAEASFAIIGIMKAGCAYVALDPNAPADRLKFIVEDSAAKLIITAGNPAETLRTFVNSEMIDLTDPAVLRDFKCETLQLSREITPQDISYCLYTSGTTGTPKGCLLTHENAIQAMLAFQILFAGHWTTESKWLQFASFHFDVSVLEQFWSWSVGICVASAPRDLIFEDIPGAIQQLGITHIDLTPSLARLLHPDDVPSLCKGVFITGGEQLKQEILDVWGQHACIYNGYGPTEATIGVTMYPRVPKNGKPSNIGPQFENVGSFVLQPGTELPVLRGGIGELCVSGKLVGKGYLNRPELTTERFPTLSSFKERVYRTGDLVRILHDGTFLFLGRADDQVKLRGQRLELGEINEVIKKSRTDLAEVVTLVLKHKAQAKEQLVTFFVISGKNESEGSEVVPFIRDACKSRLPGYMVPTHFISIKALPLNANNKADSKQLAAIFNNLSMEDLQTLSLSEQSHADWTEREKDVVQDIIELFPVEVPNLTRSSNMFQLGIDSITMVTFSHRLRICGYSNATNATLRNNPTIGRLVEALLAKPDEGKQNLYLTAAKQNIAGFSQQHAMAICKELGVSIEKIECIAPCTPVQEGMIYRFLESDGDIYYNRLQYGLQIEVGFEELASAWDRVVSRLQILRTKFVPTNDGFAQVVLKSVDWLHEMTSETSSKTDILKRPWCLEKTGLKTQHTLILNIFHGLYDGESLKMMLNHLSDEVHAVPNIQYGPDFHSSLAYGPLAILPGANAFWKSHLETWSPHLLTNEYQDRGDFEFKSSLDVQNFEYTRKSLSVAPQAIIQAAWIATIQCVISPHLTTIGIVTSGRTMDFEEVEKVAGPLFNTVPFHLPMDCGTKITSLIKKCHYINMKMQEFQHTPLKDIKKWISAGMREQLFDTLFVFQRPDVNEKGFFDCLGWKTGAIEKSAADYPLALEATLSRGNTKLSLKIVAKKSAVTKDTANILLEKVARLVQTIVDDYLDEVAISSILPDRQQKLVSGSGLQKLAPSSSLEPFMCSSSDQPVSSVLTKQQQDIVCSEVAILAKLDKIHIYEPRSIFELGLDSIDVIKLCSRLRKNGIELSVSEIIKCQNIAKILENAKVSESKPHNSPSMEILKNTSKDLERHLNSSLPSDFERVLPATPLQESMLKEMVQSNFRRYFTVQVFQLNTLTREKELLRAVDHVIKNSPILRTTFFEVHDPQSPVNYAQVVDKNWEKVAEAHVVQGPNSSSLEELLKREEGKLRSSWASIEKHMFGIVPVHFENKKYIIVAISHALYDGGSLPMIHDDIRKAYYGHEITKRPDYAWYIADALHSISDEAEDFWKATLWNSPPSVFPKQESPPKQKKGNTHRHDRPSVFSLQEVKSFCSSSNITLQTLGQICWAFVLAELMGQLDVVFGTVLACRDTSEAGQVNFPLFNTVAVRSVIRGTLDQMLRDMQEKSVITRQFQHFPLRKAQAYALGSRNTSTKDTTLFDTLFTFQGARPEDNEIDSLYSSIGGSSDVEYAICVEMEIEERFDRLYWTAACKSEARNMKQTKEIIDILDLILGRIMKNKQEEAIMIHSNGISICGFQIFQPRVIAQPQILPRKPTFSEPWTKTELKIRESISVISGLSEENILVDSTIFQLGLDSITVLKLPTLLKKHNIDLTASEIMKYLTIRDIANHLSGKPKPKEDSTIDFDTILVESTSWVAKPYLKRLKTSHGPIEYIMPATAGQTYMIRRWHASQGSLFYPTFKFRLFGGFDASRLDFAWFQLLSQHDILRTGFIVSDTDSRIAQIVYTGPSSKIIYTTEPPKFEDWAEYSGIKHLEEPPLRLFVVRNSSKSDTSNQDVELHLYIHHALYDGVSISLLIKKLRASYENSDSIFRSLITSSIAEERWKIFVATTIKEKNKQSVKDQWLEYLGSPNHNKSFGSSTGIDPTDEGKRRTELFMPGVKAKNLKSLAQLHGVSVDHILIVMASKLFGKTRFENNPHARNPCKPDSDIIVGLYLANRFPFSQDLTKVFAPTLNLLPIKINTELSDEKLVQGVQRDLGMIGDGGMANVSLDDIYQWTGVRVHGWVNIVKGVDENQKAYQDAEVDGDAYEDWQVVEKADKNAENGKMENRNENKNPCGLFCLEDDVWKTDGKEDKLLRPLVEREEYLRVVERTTNKNMKAVKDCGAYVPSIDIEFRYHPDTEEIDVGIFGPENMISLDEAGDWLDRLQLWFRF